jgi:hypothetical protein
MPSSSSLSASEKQSMNQAVIQVKKRPTVSKLHGTKAETRLNNLVQTIQKYQQEDERKSLSRHSSEIRIQSKKSSIQDTHDQVPVDTIDLTLNGVTLNE